MTLPIWPSALPWRPERASWQRTGFVTPAVVTENEEGPNRQRPQGFAIWTGFQVTVPMTHAEFGIWLSFIGDTLVQATSRFMMPVWSPATPNGTPNRVAYIPGAKTSETMRGLTVLVTFPLAVRDY